MVAGVIFVGYNCVDTLEQALTPWVQARSRWKENGHQIIIDAVSVPFIGFPQGLPDNTYYILRDHAIQGHIRNLYIDGGPMKETDARGLALRSLVKSNVGVLIQWDADEVATVEEIERLLDFVESQPLIDWFRLSYRNLVFNDKTWMKDPFTPPRVHRVRVGPYKASSFYEDNNVAYNGTITRDIKLDRDMSSFTIPPSIISPKHYTWLDCDRSRRKIEYQSARGWPSCSFKWDNGLKWNASHFARLGQPIPETVSEG